MAKFDQGLFKTVWHPKREVAIDSQSLLDHALENNTVELEDEKIDAIRAVARKLQDEHKPEAQSVEQPAGKKRVIRTAAQAQARAAAYRKSNTKK